MSLTWRHRLLERTRSSHPSTSLQAVLGEQITSKQKVLQARIYARCSVGGVSLQVTLRKLSHAWGSERARVAQCVSLIAHVVWSVSHRGCCISKRLGRCWVRVGSAKHLRICARTQPPTLGVDLLKHRPGLRQYR